MIFEHIIPDTVGHIHNILNLHYISEGEKTYLRRTDFGINIEQSYLGYLGARDFVTKYKRNWDEFYYIGITSLSKPNFITNSVTIESYSENNDKIFEKMEKNVGEYINFHRENYNTIILNIINPDHYIELTVVCHGNGLRLNIMLQNE